MADSGGGNAWTAITGFLDEASPNLGALIGGFSGAPASIGDMTATIGGFVTDVSQAIKMVAWLFVPSHWVRILAGFAGLLFLGGSLYMFKEAL